MPIVPNELTAGRLGDVAVAVYVFGGTVEKWENRTWAVEAAEIQDGMMQVLWRSGDERRCDEHAPGSPIIVDQETAAGKQRILMIKSAGALAVGDRGLDVLAFHVSGVERAGSAVMVEWSNGVATRVRNYDAFDGVLVEVVDLFPG